MSCMSLTWLCVDWALIITSDDKISAARLGSVSFYSGMFLLKARLCKSSHQSIHYLHFAFCWPVSASYEKPTLPVSADWNEKAGIWALQNREGKKKLSALSGCSHFMGSLEASGEIVMVGPPRLWLSSFSFQSTRRDKTNKWISFFCYRFRIMSIKRFIAAQHTTSHNQPLLFKHKKSSGCNSSPSSRDEHW